MTYIYLSDSDQNGIQSTQNILKENDVKMFDWSVFNRIDLRSNSVEYIQAIKNCVCFCAVLDNPDHKYQGTFELMAIALAIGKPVYVYIPKNPGTYRHHDVRTEFDRLWLYHPDVHIFSHEKADHLKFISAITKCYQTAEEEKSRKRKRDEDHFHNFEVLGC